jgi:hypothetical protein
LESFQLPPSLEPEDIDHDIYDQSRKDFFLECDDGDLTDDEDYTPENLSESRFAKRPRLSEAAVLLILDSPLVCAYFQFALIGPRT